MGVMGVMGKFGFPKIFDVKYGNVKRPMTPMTPMPIHEIAASPMVYQKKFGKMN